VNHDRVVVAGMGGHRQFHGGQRRRMHAPGRVWWLGDRQVDQCVTPTGGEQLVVVPVAAGTRRVLSTRYLTGAAMMSRTGVRARPAVSGCRNRFEEREMPRYLLIIDYRPGVVDAPMDEWPPETIMAHLDYYREQLKEIRDSGELVADEALTGMEYAKVVTSDGAGSTVVTDGPFAEFKEMLAGFQLVDVESLDRAVEIAARISAVPGPGGVPLQQPVTIRRAMSAGEWAALSPS
jgi:hypothetical protein